MADTGALQSVLPDYEITSELGRGAMGIVYLGRHKALNRQVAIKELPASFAVDQLVRDRFLTEARVVASLDHPHVVVIHDFVDRNGHLALVMEHLPNGTVWEQFLQYGLAAPRACGLVLATLAGVHHAHDRGIMHRDIKPENLIFTHDWQLKVTDFGIAQVLSGDETVGTADGAIIGTPAYMSPEQAEGRRCGPPADVYASGAMLYEMLTGALPFPDAEGPMEMATARLHRDPVPIETVGPLIPGAIAEVTMHALKRSETERFASAEEFGVALGEAAADTWGPEWMAESGTVVHGSEAIERACHTTGGSTLRRSRAAGEDARSTAVLPGDPNATGAPPAPPAPPVAEMQPVAALHRVHLQGADLHNLVPDDVFNLAEVRSPRSPVPSGLVALAALVAAILVAITGLGGDPDPVNAQGVTVAGVPVGLVAEPIEVDMGEPFVVGGTDAESFDASFLGIPLGSGSIVDGEFDPGYLQYTAAGVVELSGGQGATEVSFPVRPTNSVYPTAPFVVTAMIALGGLATVQANLRGMRARRVRVGPYVGLVVSGAISGASLAVLAMLTMQTPASRSTVVVSALLAALGSLALGEAFRRWRRRRRLRHVRVATARR